MEKQWHVYILECQDGTLYTGITTNLDARMKAHAEGKGSKYVYQRGFKQLLKAQPCKDKSDACKSEFAIKRLHRNEKLDWFD